jgi:hypothetical protein
MVINSEPGKSPETEKPVEPGKDAESRAPVSDSQPPGSATKPTRPKSPREFIQERMRELDKKDS